MGTDPRPRRRGTPISDNLGADLQALGSILASHTRGLDDYLQRQAQRLEQRQGLLLAETPGLLVPQDRNLEALTAGELQDLCRRKRLRGWSKLKRHDLITFLKQALGPELEMMRILSQEPTSPEAAASAESTAAFPTAVFPADASRTERLLLLLLRYLEVPQEELEACWQADNKQPGSSA
jgi:hypothetical protein